MTPTTLDAIIESHREVIVQRYVAAVLLEGVAPSDASPEQIIDHLRQMLDGLVERLRRSSEATAHDDASTRNSSARHHGGQRWMLGLSLDDLVREYGVLRNVIVGVVKETGCQPSIDEWNILTMCLTVGIAESVTEYARRREREAVEAREEAIATVSHDLKNPLSVVRGSALLLEKVSGKGAADLALIAKLSGTIARAAQRMDQLVTDLLDLSRFEAGHPGLNPTEERAGDLLAAAREAALPVAEARGTEIEWSAAEVALWCDRERVLQVLANLLGNAVKFSPEGSKVTLRAEDRDVAVEFSVQDQGPGIPASQLPHLFERYWRSPDAAAGGTGLGLAIVRKIVEAHHGSVHVRSVPGAGSLFVFTLPKGDGTRGTTSAP